MLLPLRLLLQTLYSGLASLLCFEGDVAEVYQRNFEIDAEFLGMKYTVELKANGHSYSLDSYNRRGRDICVPVFLLWKPDGPTDAFIRFGILHKVAILSVQS
jgi:hypothetical protein